MSAFPQPLASIVAPLLADNIDTDTIIPSREIKTTGRDGLADGMFAPWRYSDVDARTPNTDFALNQPEYAEATIIAGGANFGCGSSREHAVWALSEYGIKAIIAESFAPIFRNKCIRNFLLPVALPREAVEACARQMVTVDLLQQEVRTQTGSYPFEIDAEAKQMLSEGLDTIDMTLTQSNAIDAWLAEDAKQRPWVYLEKPA